MASRFEKFSESARRVLSLAQEEAQRFNHNYIGTEHILLGLVRENDGVAAKVLSNLSVELTKVRSAVEFIIGRGERSAPGEIGLTPRAKKVIELAVDEARRLVDIEGEGRHRAVEGEFPVAIGLGRGLKIDRRVGVRHCRVRITGLDLNLAFGHSRLQLGIVIPI